jgi:hypothetical protein
LAERLLGRVMDWGSEDLREHIPGLQALAEVKYDEYGNYGPGSKFVENLAGWLAQFETPEDRRVALEFVERGLVFISEIEVNHLIGLVPSTVFARILRERIANEQGIETHRIAEIERHPDFARLRRRVLVIAASDGARVDRLRRASGLSHEQFIQAASPSVDQLTKLTEALRGHELLQGDQTATFGHVFVVDDFSGSGTSLVRASRSGDGWTGKLARLQEALANAATQGLIDIDVPGTMVLYIASDQALSQIREGLEKLGMANWSVECVQCLPARIKVDTTFPAMAELCRRYFDQVTIDPDKGATPIGYEDCALPLVLAHNTPNNSVCLLWSDTRDRDDGDHRRALFPRYERHHPDRK